MRRIWWTGLGLSLGIGLGVTAAYLAYRRFEAVRRAASPEGIAKRVDQATRTVNEVVAQIRQAAASREAELRETLLES
ncbi:MAG: hypothetical protein LBG11_11350 [Bifidobacteriaceae bacterium]|nr:hypothetical protein [Bifidobacteriaceae bacterium]